MELMLVGAAIMAVGFFIGFMLAMAAERSRGKHVTTNVRNEPPDRWHDA